MQWVKEGVAMQKYYGGCNTDIQLHINKGVIGLRLDNIDSFIVNATNIYNLLNTGPLGTETAICGAYTQGNAHQDPLITPGYTGTEGYGITITQSINGKLNNINIQNIETHRGNANGIALFKDSSVDFNTITINNIIAGSQLDINSLRPQQNYLPNKIPVACSIFDNNYNTQYTLSTNYNLDQSAPKVIGTNINGFLLCNGDKLIGECSNSSCVALYDEAYFDQLASIAAIQQKAITFNQSNNTHHASIVIILLSIIVIIIAASCYYVKYNENNQKNHYKLISDTPSLLISSQQNNESTPLLTN